MTVAAPARRTAIAAWFALAAYATLLWETAAPWPDDWDGVGFVESIRDFDLERFHPHPPGYPVYVALLRLAAGVVGGPMRACDAVAVVCGAVAVAFVWDAVRRATGNRAAWMAATFVGTAPIVWRACSGVGSEAPALACAAACAWGLAAGRSVGASVGATVLGIGAGLGMGVRLSWGPLYIAALALASSGSRARAWGAAALACVAWVVPVVACVGAHTLWALSVAHLAGHASRWGGTFVTDPGARRIGWLARDIFGDGLGVGADPLGLARGAFVGIAMVEALRFWRSSGWRGWRSALGAVVPYLAWVGVGQNIRDQPRHVVPLVALFCAALAIASARQRVATTAFGLLVLLVAVRTAADARARRTVPPPGLQLVDLARAQPSPGRLIVFGGASVRFFEIAQSGPKAMLAASLGDAEMALTRLDALPSRVWVTSEVTGVNDSRSPLDTVAVLCRPPRLDRRMPCLQVYAWKLPFLPAE